MARDPDGVTQITQSVRRIHRAGVNCYLVVQRDGILLVDAGLPGMWRDVVEALRLVGATPDDVTTVLLTHGHFDHVGLCERLRSEHGVISRVHPSDEQLVRHPYRYAHENARWWYPFRHPGGVPLLPRMTAAGALRVPASTARADVVPNVPVDAPGSPVPVWSPGHTAGHCAFLLPEEGVLFSGDALVTLDPYTGRRGPQIIAGAATADSAQALRSLDRLVATGAGTLLPGHGDPWTGSVAAAVDEARGVGAH